jgi:large subunit ribosomal protein L15
MPTRLRKQRKMRGTRTVGYGQIGQHRKHPGGRGKAGRHKHKWSWVTTYEPDYFGSRGFRPPSPNKERSWLNVGDLEGLHAKLLRMKEGEMQDGLPVLNLAKMGVGKLLGAGKVEKPFVVVVSKFTDQAKAKVEAAGGKVKEA